MSIRTATRSLFVTVIIATLAACGGGGGGTVTPPSNNPGPTAPPTTSPSPSATATPSPTPTPKPTASPTASPTATPSPAAPQLIHVGFDLAEHTDATFGPVYFYSTVLNGMAQVIRVTHGSKVVFVNDDPSGTPHTASGFGSGGFPSSFNNSSGFTQNGTTIDGSTTWSTGTLNRGQMSQVFTVGPAGTYYFGCNFHYTTAPTASNSSMGDVLVSM
jgi:plastocyanin